jgi:hypothetical protein
MYVKLSGNGGACVKCLPNLVGVITTAQEADEQTTITQLPLGGSIGLWQGAMPLRNLIAYAYKGHVDSLDAEQLTQDWLLLKRHDDNNRVHITFVDGVVTNLSPGNLATSRPREIDGFIAGVNMLMVCFAKVKAKPCAWDATDVDCICCGPISANAVHVCTLHQAQDAEVAKIKQVVKDELVVRKLKQLFAAAHPTAACKDNSCGRLACRSCLWAQLKDLGHDAPRLPHFSSANYALQGMLALVEAPRELDVDAAEPGKCLALLSTGGLRLCSKPSANPHDVVCQKHLLQSRPSPTDVRCAIRKHIAFAAWCAAQGGPTAPPELSIWAHRAITGHDDARKYADRMQKCCSLIIRRN